MPERTDDIGFDGLKLIQDTDAFCFGIDAVLLADFASKKKHRKVIDLGTNNAVIPLIISRLSETAHITGVEKQERSFKVAGRNVELNGMGERIDIVHSDILDLPDIYRKGSFDAVVSNPPYMAKGTGVINETDLLMTARHETSADLKDFIKCAAYLLQDKGTFYMIHRPNRLVDISCACREYRLEPKFIQFISPRRGVKPNLMLIECRKNGGRELKFLDPLEVYDMSGDYTDEILKIYRKK